MGSNFYWKKIPKELEQYKESVAQHMDCYDKRDSVLKHIGKRSMAGLYCYDCGTTFHKYGTDQIHGGMNPSFGNREEIEKERDMYWYRVCPVCGKEGTYICTFRWTIMKHKWLVEKLVNVGCTEKLIVNEYGDEYTPTEFLQEVYTPVEYQTCQEFT